MLRSHLTQPTYETLNSRRVQTVFGYIDRILANAALAGLKMIVVPINNWEEVDGVPVYLEVPSSPVL